MRRLSSDECFRHVAIGHVVAEFFVQFPCGMIMLEHMQGKSCFNFTKLDDLPAEELRQLIIKGIERFWQTQSHLT